MFIHSNKKYIERSMYLINPYMNAPDVPSLPMEAFVAPDNFSVAAQEMDIVQAYANYSNPNKKYIYLVSSLVQSTTLTNYGVDVNYAYSENGGNYTVIQSGTITWTSGSNRRNIIYIYTGILPTIQANIPVGAVWVYLGDKVNEFLNAGNTYLKYVHCQLLTSIKSIGYTDFYGCTGITKVNIPLTVTTLGYASFYGCTGLTLMNIPNWITSISNACFQNCSGLTIITIPDSVVEIKASAFQGCLNAVFTIARLKLTNLEPNAFISCRKMASIDLSLSTITYIGDTTFQDCQLLQSIVLPSTITSIGYACFWHCYALNSINLPNGLITINSIAFLNCSGLNSVSLPSSLVNLLDGAFQGCSGLTGNFVIPNSVTNLGGTILDGCSKITGVVFPSSITSLKSAIIRGCSKLTSVTIPTGVTHIYDEVFNSCTSLSSIDIPSGVTTIDFAAFYNCTGLTRMNCHAQNPPTLTGGAIFQNVTKTILHVPVGRKSSFDAVAQWTDFEPIVEDL